MTSSVLQSRPPGTKSAIPPLCNGDHLPRDEFERRYESMTGVNKAELIEAVVHMPPADVAQNPPETQPPHRTAFSDGFQHRQRESTGLRVPALV